MSTFNPFLIVNKIQPDAFSSDCAGSAQDGAAYKTDRDGNPDVFKLKHDENGLWLNDNWTKPENRWNPDNEFVFALRKSLLFHAIGRGFSCPGFLRSFSIPRTFYPPHPVLKPYPCNVYGKST